MALSRVLAGKNTNYGTGYSLDNTGSTTNVGSQTTGGTTTLSFAIGASANRLLIVSISYWNNGGTAAGCSGVTFNGTAMTLVSGSAINSVGGKFRTEQWYLIAPTNTTANIVATVGGQCDKLGLAATSFFGVNQTTPVDANTSASGTAASVTASITTNNGSEYMVDCVCHLSANTASSSTNTSIYNDGAVGAGVAAQYGLSAAAGSSSMSWTYPDPGDEWAYSVLAVKPIIDFVANDLAVIVCINSTNNTVPSTPSGYTSLSSAQQSADGSAMAIFYKFMGASEAYPTITNSNASIYAIYRGVNLTTPFVQTGGQTSTGSSATISYSGIGAFQNAGKDWVLTFGVAHQANAAVGSSPPTSMTLPTNGEITGTPYDVALFDSNTTLSSYSFNSKTLANAAVWMTKTTELQAAAATSLPRSLVVMQAVNRAGTY